MVIAEATGTVVTEFAGQLVTSGPQLVMVSIVVTSMVEVPSTPHPELP